MNTEPRPLEIEIVGNNSLATMMRAEIDMQITTAKQYPRNYAATKRNMLALATLDVETAEGCFYKLNRQGKSIEGPSVRMAEIATTCFQNIRAGARVIENDGKTITAQGFCHDLENNVMTTVEVRRRITDKNGSRYSDDMQVVTGNAACAIAYRNAVFKVIPMALISPVYLAAKQVAIGDIKTLADRRTGALRHFSKLGITDKQVFTYLDVTGAEDIGLEHLETLTGLKTAIAEGSTTVDEVFAAKAATAYKNPFPPSPETPTTTDGEAPEAINTKKEVVK